jgi:hypothetical protein
VSQPSSGKIWQPTLTGDGFTLGSTGSTFSSLGANGKTIPGALQIEFVIPVYPYHAFQGNSLITIRGVGLGMIGGTANLNGQNFTLAGGMQPGLPLATSAFQDDQSGILLQGVVFQAFGNWQLTDQSIHLVCNPGASNQNDQNINWNWMAGTSLASAINQALTPAFPAYKIDTSAVSPNLVLSNTEQGQYTSLANFANMVNQMSLKLGIPQFGQNYQGIWITVQGNKIIALDGTNNPAIKTLRFQDFVGQVTWQDAATVNFKMMMRADIKVGDQIKFPTGIQSPYALTSQNAAVPNSPASSKLSFSGTFMVSEVHHFASFRQADADSWATAISAVTSLTVPT